MATMSDLILVDSSVWIDHFNQNITPQVEFLRRSIPSDRLALPDLVLVEVLMGIRDDLRFARIRRDMGGFLVVQLVSSNVAMRCVDHYRYLRRQGVTVRSLVDCLIATYCIEAGCELLHSDRDFEPFERHLGLRAVDG